MIGARPVLAAVLLLGTPGCGGPVDDGPPQIHFGEDVCAVCGMIISDDRFAAGIVLAGDGDGLTKSAFDDIGCLLDYETTLEDRAVVARWVRDFRTRAWRDATAATYAHSAELHTPMAFGLAACGGAAAAEAILDEYPGDAIDFMTARNRFEAGELVPRMHEGSRE